MTAAATRAGGLVSLPLVDDLLIALQATADPAVVNGRYADQLIMTGGTEISVSRHGWTDWR
jgi:hypothetical protein